MIAEKHSSTAKSAAVGLPDTIFAGLSFPAGNPSQEKGRPCLESSMLIIKLIYMYFPLKFSKIFMIFAH